MTHALSPATLGAISRALDVDEIRQQVHAHNVANAGVTGFTAKTPVFSAQLASASEALGPSESIVSIRDTGQPVELTAELADMSQNAVHYQSLVKLLNRHYAIASMVLNDGKR